MLEKKTQVLSLQAYLIHHNNCYQSISIEVLEKMFALDQLTILSEVNLLLVQGLVEASWNEDATVFIASALLPAQVLAVDVKDEEKFAQVIVPDDQLSLAIGKSGQNARLSAKLTNWKIDIKSESQFRKMLEESQEIPSEETDEVEETESTDENV